MPPLPHPPICIYARWVYHLSYLKSLCARYLHPISIRGDQLLSACKLCLNWTRTRTYDSPFDLPSKAAPKKRVSVELFPAKSQLFCTNSAISRLVGNPLALVPHIPLTLSNKTRVRLQDWRSMRSSRRRQSFVRLKRTTLISAAHRHPEVQQKPSE